jgi:hypothetical protein
MVQRFNVCTADIHTWAAADGFQPFKNLNIFGFV